MTDYLQHVLGHASSVEGKSDLTWRVKFTDGDIKGGKIEHLGGSAYLLVREDPIYFNSAQVIRLHVDPNP